jgi:hypothetical protein
MDRREILLDHDSGLHVAWYFWLRVLDEVNRSNRYGSPFGLLLLTAESAGTSQRSLDEAVALVPAVIRGTDIGGRLAVHRVGVLLIEQDGEGAPAAAERIMGELAEHRAVRWRSQLLLYPGDAAEISHLLTHEPRRNHAEEPAVRAG